MVLLIKKRVSFILSVVLLLLVVSFANADLFQGFDTWDVTDNNSHTITNNEWVLSDSIVKDSSFDIPVSAPNAAFFLCESGSFLQTPELTSGVVKITFYCKNYRFAPNAVIPLQVLSSQDGTNWTLITTVNCTSESEWQCKEININDNNIRYAKILKNETTSCPKLIGIDCVTVITSSSNILYVSTNSLSNGPGTEWPNAFHTIQDALDAASFNDLILVTNGVYDVGGRAVQGGMTNRVAVDKAITVQSVNGPAFTIIKGAGPLGDGAVRCAYVGTNAILSGFTLTNGHTKKNGDYSTERSGGGAWLESCGIIKNCIISGNTADDCGGGSFGGTLNNCVINGNIANDSGGGASDGVLNNCTLIENSADRYGGGSYHGTLNNCIVWYNDATLSGDNWYISTLRYCCTTPLPSGTGNITNNPQLLSFCYISSFSPCIGGGSTNYVSEVDIDGEEWLNPPSIGCDEYHAGSVTGNLSVAISSVLFTNVIIGTEVDLNGMITGRASVSEWNFDDGIIISNRLNVLYSWASTGVYDVVFTAFNETYPDGVSTSVTIRVWAPVHYVNKDASTPVFPYLSWETAATNIQDAIDATVADGMVWVTNGLYDAGSTIVYGNLRNRVVIDKAITVQSVNGPAVTIIKGAGPNGDGAVRCAYVGTNAVLSGFTLTNGHTITSGDYSKERSGGGVWCETGGVVSNCIVRDNAAAAYGGGSYRGILNNCTLISNSANWGGCSYYGTLNNCTIIGNSAYYGGGSYRGTLNNSIIWNNTASYGNNWYEDTLNYCCTLPQPSGIGNITNNPQILSSYYISSSSPCIGAGSSNYVSGIDIDGEEWLNPPSIGCDEYHAESVTGDLSVVISSISFTNIVPEFKVDLTGIINGRVSGSSWDFADGVIVSNRLNISHSWSSTGVYDVMFTAYNETYPAGVSSTVTVTVSVQQVHYVNTNSVNPVAPYSSWVTAATNIQDAIDSAIQPTALVLVTNGVYDVGGRAVYGSMTNRVVIDKIVTVQSVNGPDVTIINGKKGVGWVGDGAIRCVYVGENAVLAGFTLTNGHTRTSSNYSEELSGGGVWSEIGGVISNCVLIGNTANYGGGSYEGTLNNCVLVDNYATDGGGSFKGILNNCVLISNSATIGGGSFSSTLNNCTVSGNKADEYGGGSHRGALNNCIIWNNMSLIGDNWFKSTLNYCCTVPQPSGTGNITNNPQLLSSCCISSSSPCIGSGSTNYLSGIDIDGEEWLNPPSIGCDEYHTGFVTGNLSVAISSILFTNVIIGFEVDLTGMINGRASGSRWDFADGVIVSNILNVSHSWSATGVYDVIFTAYNETYPAGMSSTVTVTVSVQQVHYVDAGSINPVTPYSSWSTAATNIQDAIDSVVQPMALVLVTNGIYDTGGRAVYGSMTNRVAIDKPITIRSVNGPSVTIIKGVGPNGYGAVRCVYAGETAVLSGFTLTNGHTRTSGDYYKERSGGGVWSETGGVISDSVISGNAAANYGGGSYHGTLNNCALIGNTANYGGGSYQGTLNNCTISENTASSSGGGSCEGVLNNCVIIGNYAGIDGGGSFSFGSFSSMFNNCTVSGNMAGEYGGGSHNCIMNNCIIWYNTAISGGDNYYYGLHDYCCTTPLVAGMGNISDEPQFVASNDYHLAVSSPCIDVGDNDRCLGVSDIEGTTRIIDGDGNGTATVDMGCYEYSAEITDSDGDGATDADEYVAGTDMTNSNSYFAVTAISNIFPVIVCFESLVSRSYTLQGCTNLVGGIWSNIIGGGPRAGVNGDDFMQDTNLPLQVKFYRIKVEF